MVSFDLSDRRFNSELRAWENWMLNEHLDEEDDFEEEDRELIDD